jgi:hypothetical protein
MTMTLAISVNERLVIMVVVVAVVVVVVVGAMMMMIMVMTIREGAVVTEKWGPVVVHRKVRFHQDCVCRNCYSAVGEDAYRRQTV